MMWWDSPVISSNTINSSSKLDKRPSRPELLRKAYEPRSSWAEQVICKALPKVKDGKEIGGRELSFPFDYIFPLQSLLGSDGLC